MDKQGPDILDRLLIKTGQMKDYLEMEQEIRKNWQHAYSPTDKQVSGLLDAYNQRVREAAPIRYKPRRKEYYQIFGGKRLPKLASAGIVRKTYRTRGTRTTRYIVPGRSGLFSLASARKLFLEI